MCSFLSYGHAPLALNQFISCYGGMGRIRTGGVLTCAVCAGYEEFLSVCQKLGVYMTTREALGLFGRYDYLSDEMNGHVDYFEFIKIMFGESESTITGTAQSKA